MSFGYEMLKEFIREEEGWNLLEYSLVFSLVALVASIFLSELGRALVNVFESQRRDFNHPSNPFHN